MNIWAISLKENIATHRQTEALAQAIVAISPEGNKPSVTHFHPKPPCIDPNQLPNDGKLNANQGTTWDKSLTIEELTTLDFHPPWPDCIISCRPEVVAIALGIKNASGGKTQIVHIQDPNDGGRYHFDLSQFDHILLQPHEKLSGGNIIRTPQALHGLTPEIFKRTRQDNAYIIRHLRQPVLTVLIGGSDKNFEWQPRHAHKLAHDLQKLAREHHGSIVIVTSRRTGEIAKPLRKKVSALPNVLFDDPRLNYTTALAAASSILITGDSRSMIDEARATGKPCTIYDCDGSLQKHPTMLGLRNLLAKKELTVFPAISKGVIRPPANILLPLAWRIQQTLSP